MERRNARVLFWCYCTILFIVVSIVDGEGFIPIPGVHTPLKINPNVEIMNGQWLFDLYQVLLGRMEDAQGFRTNFVDLQNGASQQQIYNAFVGSAEFQRNSGLQNPAGYVTRAYQVLLHRNPSPAEVNNWVSQMKTYNGQGSQPYTWNQILYELYGSLEYKNNCPNEYYTLGARVYPQSLLMESLFNGSARMQVTTESQVLNIKLPTAQRLWDQKMPIIHNPNNVTDGFPFVAFTRAFLGGNAFTITALASNDAVNFYEIGALFELTSSGMGSTFYDGHVSVDNSVCPPQYIMSMECIGNGGAASLCVSYSTFPSKPETWTKPVVIVDGCTGGNPSWCKTIADESASTGVLLTDGFNKYVSWTQVYDGLNPPNDPLAHTYSQNAGGSVASFYQYYGSVMGPTAGGPPVSIMMSSEPHPWCTDAWDCNNRDKQDWKREGNYFYALYNGANYYRCDGKWGISIARNTRPVGVEYTDRLPISRGIPAVVSNTCGISYPMLNVINGELFVYYAFVNVTGHQFTHEGKTRTNINTL